MSNKSNTVTLDLETYNRLKEMAQFKKSHTIYYPFFGTVETNDEAVKTLSESLKGCYEENKKLNARIQELEANRKWWQFKLWGK